MTRLPIIVRHLGLTRYETVWHNMQAYTAQRGADTADAFWVTEHYPVYTLGLAGREEHLHRQRFEDMPVPVVKCDRGGQITYHGIGQVVIYTLMDLSRAGIGVRQWVDALEQAAIDVLAEYGLQGTRMEGRPGVYVQGQKIAALGLRVRRGCCYHGLSLNINVDLIPFSFIAPCGYADLSTTSIQTLGINTMHNICENQLIERVQHYFEWHKKQNTH